MDNHVLHSQSVVFINILSVIKLSAKIDYNVYFQKIVLRNRQLKPYIATYTSQKQKYLMKIMVPRKL